MFHLKTSDAFSPSTHTTTAFWVSENANFQKQGLKRKYKHKFNWWHGMAIAVPAALLRYLHSYYGQNCSNKNMTSGQSVLQTIELKKKKNSSIIVILFSDVDFSKLHHGQNLENNAAVLMGDSSYQRVYPLSYQGFFHSWLGHQFRLACVCVLSLWCDLVLTSRWTMGPSSAGSSTFLHLALDQTPPIQVLLYCNINWGQGQHNWPLFI